MNFKGMVLGVMGLAVSCSVAAQSVDYGSFVLDFDELSAFGAPSADLSGPNGLVSLSWTVPDSVHLAVNGGVDFADFDLPSFTITACNPAYRLGGALSGFLGNLVFNEFGESQTFASIDGELTLDGFGPLVVAADLTRTLTASNAGQTASGYFALAASAPLGEFSTLSFANGHLNLTMFGTGAITAQPQNILRVSFVASPVPVPTAVWLFASALSGLACLRRRQS